MYPNIIFVILVIFDLDGKRGILFIPFRPAYYNSDEQPVQFYSS